MRTLKKTLCLVLALVMMLGLCAISASATDLPDDDKIADDYREAFEIANALGIITGAEIGGEVVANPQGDMTRVQGCYYIARLLKGNYGTGTSSMFTDVSGQDAAVVEWMVAQGYTEGNGDGTFEPYNKMLGMHFAKWLLTALGYDAETEGLTGVGDKWEGQVRILTARAGLTRGITGYDQNAVLTREQAAQMVLNALQSDLQYYPNTVRYGDVTVMGSPESMPRTETNAENYFGSNGGNGAYQLVEMYYPSLKKVSNITNSNISKDDLNTPMTHTWELNGKELCRVLAAPVMTYTGKVNEKTVANDLAGYYINVNGTKTAINTSTKTGSGDSSDGRFIYVNGAPENIISGASSNTLTFTNNKSLADIIATMTMNGRKVELYATSNADKTIINKIVVTAYTVAKVKEIKTSGTETKYTFEAAVKDQSIGTRNASTFSDNSKDTLIADGALAEKDIVTLTWADNDTNTLYAYKTYQFSGMQSDYTASKNEVKIDGDMYYVAAGVYMNDAQGMLTTADHFKTNSDKDEANYWQDQFGYLVYTDSISKAPNTNYAFIVKVQGTDGKDEYGVTGKPSVKVWAILSNGEYKEFDVEVETVKKTDLASKTRTVYYINDGTTWASKTLTSADDVSAKEFYVIKGTDILLSNPSATGITPGDDVKVNAKATAQLLMSDLHGYVYNYKLSDDGKTITLEKLKSGYTNTATGIVKGDFYAGRTETSVRPSMLSYGVIEDKANNYYTNAKDVTYSGGTNSSAVTVVVNGNTPVFVYDTDKDKVTPYTGVSKIDSNNSSKLTFFAAEGNANDNGRLSAKVLYIIASSDLASTVSDTKQYAYVVGKDVNKGTNTNTYTAWLQNGEKTTVIDEKKDNAFKITATGDDVDGVYEIKDGKIVEKVTLATTVSKDNRIVKVTHGTGSNVVNNTITTDYATSEGNKTWDITGATIVKIDGDDHDEKNGDLYVILGLGSNDLNGKVQTIFCRKAANAP